MGTRTNTKFLSGLRLDHYKNLTKTGTGTGTGTKTFLPGLDRDRDRKKVILQFPNSRSTKKLYFFE
jgi:hypothetical protein